MGVPLQAVGRSGSKGQTRFVHAQRAEILTISTTENGSALGSCEAAGEKGAWEHASGQQHNARSHEASAAFDDSTWTSANHFARINVLAIEAPVGASIALVGA
jgi:hypothetical protein